MSTTSLAAQTFVALNWLLACACLWHAVAALRGMATLPDLTLMEAAALPLLSGGDGPDLTVVVPACNEEKSIEATLRSLLGSAGLRLEVIAVNDRSTDRTGQRMDEVAAEAAASGGVHCLRVIHIRELPTGWLGKPHAMALGAQQARAPWILFTDGDVIFRPEALELALRHVEGAKADHVVLVPTLILKTVAETAMLAAMNYLGGWTVRLWKVADPRARDFIGVGGFNLIRREVYERLGGFEGLRMEVLDDMRLGWLVKRGGYQQQVAVGPGLVRIRWLQGALGVIRLAEKNGFAALRYRVGLTLLACLVLAALIVLPLLAIAAGGLALGAGLLTYGSVAMAYWANRKVTAASPWLAVLFAPAAGVVLYAGLRSMLLALVRRGVDWRGTRYQLDELRRHAGRGW
ncbi:MAG TPA: glycosyltransferase family 2 protein [Terracidiphilus sp.]|nr:glycosyltransferase family 2 protein [Terracidiphilus sp.]